MADPSENVEAAIVASFLSRFAEDRTQGVERSPAEYRGMFPGYEALIDKELERLAKGTSGASSDRQAFSIGHFRLTRELGRGGQGVVYLAEDLRLGRNVALKVLPRARAVLSPAAKMRFEREIEILSRLEEPGICPLYEVGSDEAYSWFAMRYVEGETLAVTLARKGQGAPIPAWLTMGSSATDDSRGAVLSSSTPAEAEVYGFVRLIERAARIMHCAHQFGIVHRDIKPSNIVVSSDGSPVVVDFGTAQLEGEQEDRVTRSGEAPGTPAYMSPEQLDRRPLSHYTDIWSIGVTLYECLASQRPFRGSSTHQLAASICRDEPADILSCNAALPRDLTVVLQRAMQKKPTDRYASALDLAEDLRRVLSGEPIQARPIPSWVRLLRWGQRNPALAASGALTLLVLLSCLFVSLWLLTEARRAREVSSARAEALQEVVDFQSRQLAAVSPEQIGQSLRDSIIRAASPGEREALKHAISGLDLGSVGRDVLESRLSLPRQEAVERRFADQPLVEAQLLHALGERHLEIGLLDLAAGPLCRALSLRSDLLGDSDPLTLSAMDSWGRLLYMQGRYGEAEKHLREALDGRRRGLGDEHPDTVSSLGHLELVLEAKRASGADERSE